MQQRHHSTAEYVFKCRILYGSHLEKSSNALMLNCTTQKLGLVFCIWFYSNKLNLQFLLIGFWIIQMHSLGLWGTDHQYSIIPVQVWARNKSHLFALYLQPLNLRFKPRGQEKWICEMKPVRNIFAAMDIGNKRPKIFWRYTTGSERDSVQLAAVCICTRIKQTTQWNSNPS